jgi:hypothetical protein
MVSQKDLNELHGSIIEQMSALIDKGFANQARTIKQERQADLKRMGDKLERDGADLKKLIEAKLSSLEERVSEVEKKVVGLETKGSGEETQGDMMEAVLEEFQQIEIRRKNIAVFGMEEEEESGVTDETKCKKLLEEIGETADFQSYRTGPRVPERKRTIIMKFRTEAQKEKVLEKAKNLKGKEQYKKITLARDQTKQQRQLNKKKEAALKTEAEKRNAVLTEEEKNEGKWVVWGRGEGRHLVRKRN